MDAYPARRTQCAANPDSDLSTLTMTIKTTFGLLVGPIEQREVVGEKSSDKVNLKRQEVMRNYVTKGKARMRTRRGGTTDDSDDLRA